MTAKRNNPTRHAALQAENQELRRRLEEAEETLRAIREGEVDAVVVAGSRGTQIFSLSGAESVYRSIVETMQEATLTVGPGKLIARRLVQAVEMDVKAPLEPGAYARLSGVPARVELIRARLDLIRLSGLPHRFRTTYVPGLLDPEAMARLRSALPRESPFAVQAFDPRRVLDPALRERPVPLPQELRAMEAAGAGLVATPVAC